MQETGPMQGAGETFDDDATMTVGHDERRMQVRAYNFWVSLLGTRTFPSTDDLKPETISDFGPNSVLLDFSEGLEDPIVAYVGATLAQECDLTTPIRTLADVPSRSLLSRITDHYMQIVANAAPIGFEAEFVNQRGQTVLYRGILLPFARDDATIDAVYGVINWKGLSQSEAASRAEAPTPPDAAARIPAMLREAAPMTEWADGPTEETLPDAEIPLPSLELPIARFGMSSLEDEDTLASSLCDDSDLADWLAAARADADLANGLAARSRQALYAAIARAYDFALASRAAPEGYARLLEEAGITEQERAPMVALAKLVFGADYDKTRLSEFAAALAHGLRLDTPRGMLGELFTRTPGGLKAIVRAERKLRRAEAGDGESTPARRDALLAALRALTPRPLSQATSTPAPQGGPEFAVLVARRTPAGELVLLGEIDDDERLLTRAARHLIDEQG